MIVRRMGVSGVGTSTIGKQLAQRRGWPFHDADDLHPPPNVARMRSGQPLDDESRGPWLAAVHALLVRLARQGSDAVVACSALKATYRALLLDGVPGVVVVHLTAPREVLRRRIAGRAGHFMPETLLDSQLATLEPPEKTLTIDASGPVDDVVEQIEAALRRLQRP
jgi:gluconokinase